MSWEKKIVRATVEGAGPYTNVQLAFLLRRLETVPGGQDAIIAAIRDMGHWLNDHADALEAEGIAVSDTEELFRRINPEASA
ncbi:hypothetical protein A3731_24655 [Roseovarius sp. HI0049]|nr:hypothetical protein A3731_24655 [Roseovarius sp. HI0049]